MDLIKKEIVENCQMFSQLEKQMFKNYTEQNKLQKQVGNAMSNNLPPLYIKHCVFKNQFVVTYLRAYDNGIDEIHLNEFKSVINPELLKNGAFILSGYKNIDKESFPKASSPINSNVHMFDSSPEVNNSMNFTDVFDSTCDTVGGNNINSFNVQLPMKYFEYINCGHMFSATDILCGGKKEFHSKLNLIRKAYLSLSELEYVSMNEMRRLCTMYCQWIKMNINRNDLPLLIIPTVEEKPFMSTATLLHMQRESSGGTLLHHVQLRNDVNAVPTKRMMEKHKQESTETSYISSYDVLSDIKLGDEKQSSNDETSLKIHFHWNGIDSQPFQRPPHSSRIILELRTTAGESRSPANEVYLELTALDTIANTSLSQVSHLFQNTRQQQQTQGFVEKLQNFKELVSDFSYYGVNDMADENKNEEETDDLEQAMSLLIQQSFQRNDHDFTDKLWTFLRQAESSEHLKCYLDEILQSIVNGTLQPAISPTNETKLAKCIRQLYLAQTDDDKDNLKERILEFLSTDQAAFNLVSEIGYEKLRKDYFNFFLSKELAPISSLLEICKQSSGHFDLASLWKLHYCFEIVITPSIYLTLSQDCQGMLLKAALEYYASNDVAPSSPVFCLSLVPFHDSSASVHKSCEGRQAISWQKGTLSSTKTLKLASVLHSEVSKADITNAHVDDFETFKEDSIFAFEDVTTLAWNKETGFVNGNNNNSEKTK